MHLRSGKVISAWPTPFDVTGIYHDNFNSFYRHVNRLLCYDSSLYLRRIIILEICETLFVNKHLFDIDTLKWKYFINIAIQKLKNERITTFDKALYIKKLSDLL